MFEIREINASIQLGLLDLKAFSQQEGISLKRELEKSGTLYLLKELLGTNHFKLNYLSTRKPVLEASNQHISISHSHDKLAVILDKNAPTGIDIELIRDKVLQIKHKYLTHEELAIAGNNVDTLITFWAAKETLYKVYGLKEVDFKKNLRVSFGNAPYLIGTIHLGDFKKKYNMVSSREGNYRLVYILHEI